MSGSGVAESQSSTTGSSCCITRDSAAQPLRELLERDPGVRGVHEPERGQSRFHCLGWQGPGAGKRVEHGREKEELVDGAHRRLVISVVGLEALERSRGGVSR